MSPAVPRRRAVLALGAAVVLVAVSAAAWGTWATFVDRDPGAAGATSSATVVLGGRSAPPAVALTGLRAGSTTTATVTVDYRGTVPATLSLSLPATTSTACTNGVGGLLDGLNVGSLVVTLGSRAAESYCALLDGKDRVVATLQPGTVTTVPVKVTVGAIVLLPRTEAATLRLKVSGGFTDRVDGTLRITTNLLGTRSLRVAAPAASSPTVAPAVAAPPAECVDAGITEPAETISLSGNGATFDARTERPGATGPFLIISTPGADRITGSPGRDCIVGAGGDDVLDGGAGDDVLVGGDGDDRLTGGDGADRLYGNAGADTLLGGPEDPPAADVLHGGADGGDCPDAGPEDAVTACTVPPGPAAPAPATPEPGSPAPAVPEGTPDGPATEPAPPAGSTAPEPAAPAPPAADPAAPGAVPEGAPDPDGPGAATTTPPG
ncbi:MULTISPECIES: calcium-binding protein [unclassified Pseudonocardia]|uniref:calcium-binding protein n=1 Tax=unclassified Pseudonocardia TaxID=2619320 RepID=UPI00094B3447|nr:calcium-binding protein [Pseudonocardia sp. Ae707_Ps1]